MLTPEDAFVAAVNTCVMMMFIWAVERFKLDLVSYDCDAEGTKLIELDRTEIFTSVDASSQNCHSREGRGETCCREARAAGARIGAEVQSGCQFRQIRGPGRSVDRDRPMRTEIMVA